MEGITKETILNRTRFKEAVRKYESFSGGFKPRRTMVCSEEKKSIRERLKKYWEEVKYGGRTRSRRPN